MLIVMILCSFSVLSAFAADSSQDLPISSFGYINENDNLNVSRAVNPAAWGIIEINSTTYLYPQLSSYIGFTQRFYVTVTSHTGSQSGAVFLYLTSPNGNLVSNDWIIGVNEATYWDVILPASGTWTLEAVALGTDSSVSIYARWGAPIES